MMLTRRLPRWGVALFASMLIPCAATAQPVGSSAPAGLIQVYGDALKNNAAFRARLAQFEAINQVHEQARGQLLPQVGLRATYDYVHEEIQGQYFGIVDVDNEDDFDRSLIGVQLTQPLYRPELLISRDQAELARTQARFQLDTEEDALLLAVAETYFAVLSAQDLSAFAKAEREALARQLEQVQTRHAAGLVTDAELRAAQAQQARAEVGALEAETGLQAAQATLELIAGKPYARLKTLPEGMVLTRPEPARMSDWVERARTQSLAVLSAQVSTQIAALEVDKAHKLRWPRFDAAASAYRLESGGGLQGDREETEGRVGLQLSMPIYSGGSVSAAIAEAEARRVAAEALFDAAVATSARDAQLAFHAANNGMTRVPAQRTALDAAREAEAATAGGFDAGTRTTADVLRAIKDRFEAEREYSTARYEFMLDSLRLKRAAGNLANADLIRFDRLLRVYESQP